MERERLMIILPFIVIEEPPWRSGRRYHARVDPLSITQIVEDVGDVTMPGRSVTLSETPIRLGGPPYRPESDAAPILQELSMEDTLSALKRAWGLQTSDLPLTW